MNWLIITTIFTFLNHVYADPATLDPSVLAGLAFDHVDAGIGFIKVLSCTESAGQSTFTYPYGGTSGMAALEPYVISFKIVPEDQPVENIIIGEDNYAVQTVTCSNPVISITQSLEPSFNIDYPNSAMGQVNLNNFLGSSAAKGRISNSCKTSSPRSMRVIQYHACGNHGGLHLYSGGANCVWDWEDPRNGQSIAIYYGFDANRENVCAESGGLGPGDGSLYSLDPCADVTCPVPANGCKENVCIDGVCNEINKPFGELCEDNTKCNGVEACDGNGICVNGIAISCNDANPCTDDFCNPATGVCSNTPKPAGTSCSDGDPCNGNEACDASGVCQAGIAIQCDDANVCTDDFCEPDGTCSYIIRAGESCSDGDPCNGNEVCDANGACQAGIAIQCDDANACTDDFCNPDGTCLSIPKPAGTSCSDGDACNGNEACNEFGFCENGIAISCNDANPCTDDFCNSNTGECSNIPKPAGTSCSDGDPCNGNEACDAFGECQAGIAIQCDDANPCTDDVCNPDGTCSNIINDGASCSDGNACNGDEVCDANGVCQNDGNVIICDDVNPCTDDFCNPVDGTCSNTPKPAGHSCEDDNKCNGDEACDGAGECQAGIAVLCDDENQCTDDVCDTATGECSFTPKPFETPCDDGNLCSVNDYCDENGQCASIPVVCPIGEVCNGVNGECEPDCDLFDIDGYTEACSSSDIVDRIDALEAENAELQEEILGLEAAISALNDRIDDLEEGKPGKPKGPKPPPPPPKGGKGRPGRGGRGGRGGGRYSAASGFDNQGFDNINEGFDTDIDHDIDTKPSTEFINKDTLILGLLGVNMGLILILICCYLDKARKDKKVQYKKVNVYSSDEEDMKPINDLDINA